MNLSDKVKHAIENGFGVIPKDQWLRGILSDAELLERDLLSQRQETAKLRGAIEDLSDMGARHLIERGHDIRKRDGAPKRYYLEPSP